MKSLILSALLAMLVIGNSCNQDAKKNEHEGHDMAANDKDTVTHASSDDGKVKTVAVMYTDVDAKASASIKELVDHYLHVKNALAADNSTDAVAGAKGMLDAMAGMDKSLLKTDQKKTYDAIEAGLKEHAQQIASKGNDIKFQRAHFVDLSSGVYELVKSFGAGRVVYHDHCPMAKDNQGALWVSETKEIKNPYFGASMPTCGSVEEEIK